MAFYHHEDVIDAVGGLGLLVAFGATGVDAGEDDLATAAVGRQIVSALERNGVRCSWSGSIRQRIRVEPFDWRRRRWTVAPTYERVEVVPAVPRRPSLLTRILGGGAVAPPKPGRHQQRFGPRVWNRRSSRSGRKRIRRAASTAIAERLEDAREQGRLPGRSRGDTARLPAGERAHLDGTSARQLEPPGGEERDRPSRRQKQDRAGRDRVIAARRGDVIP